MWYLCKHREKKRQDPPVCCQIELGEKNPTFYWHSSWCRRDPLARLRWEHEPREMALPDSGCGGDGAEPGTWNCVSGLGYSSHRSSYFLSSPTTPPPSNSVSICFVFWSPLKQKMSHSQFHHCYESFLSPGGQICIYRLGFYHSASFTFQPKCRCNLQSHIIFSFFFFYTRMK